jgi:hypothetical protein
MTESFDSNSESVAEKLAKFRAEIQHLKETEADPHWVDINPEQLTEEDMLVWNQKDQISFDEFMKYQRKLMGPDGSQHTDSQVLSAYLANKLSPKFAEEEFRQISRDT